MPKTKTKVNPIQLQKYLKGIDYPADRERILEAARGNGADEDIISTLEQIADRDYKNPAEISKEIGRM